MATKDKPKVLCQSAIRSHTWNAAKDSVAIVPNNKEIVIYSVTGWTIPLPIAPPSQLYLGRYQ